MSNVPIFVDLQGFILNGCFTVKEVAVLRDGKTLSHYIFQEPKPRDWLTKSEKFQACWLKVHHHGLAWDDGFVPYGLRQKLVEKAIGPEPSLIYVKGTEKKRWLREILEDDDLRIETIDMDYEDIARLEDLDAIGALRCGYHAKHCAMQNVCKLYRWWFERTKYLRK